MAAPVMIELAVNGAIPRSVNPHVPRSPVEIAEVALRAIEGGASIVHNHNDEPMFTADGVHAVERTWRVGDGAGEYPERAAYPTMAAGGRGIPVHVRWRHVEELARAGMGGMTRGRPGSVNIG